MARPPKLSINYQQDGFSRGEGHSFDALAFDEAVRSQGVELIHHRAMICPLGITDKNDLIRRVHADHEGCSNGYLYKPVGIIRALVVGNTANPNQTDLGLLDGSRVQATFPRFYDVDEEYCTTGDQPVYITPFDRFYMKEREGNWLWPNWELVEFNASGVDKLRYPAVKVNHLIDSNLNEYKQGIDFDIFNGRIKWRLSDRSAKNPGIDLENNENGRGRVYTVWYLYQPYWYCDRITHEGRAVQIQDPITGQRRIEKMPMEVSLTREVAYENSMGEIDPEDSEKKPNFRAQRQPRNGSFGPG